MDSSSEVLREDGDKKSSLDNLNRDELLKKYKGLLVIAQRAKQAKNDLQQQVESYKIKLEEYVTEKNADKENIKTLQELVDSLTEQKLNYITKIDIAENKIKSLTATCGKYEAEVEKYKNEVIAKNNHISEITIQLSNFDSKVISLQRQNNRLLEENDTVLNQLSEIEARTSQFNEIGLQQREQLRLLEEKVNSGNHLDVESYTEKLNELNIKILHLETELKSSNLSYESEKEKKDKANIKLRSYKDKILKCAACINQLKNSRFILSKTVKEYSENIPKWQNDIIKASKILDEQVNGLNSEIKLLKERLCAMEQQYKDMSDWNSKLTNENRQLEIKNLELNSMLQSIQTQNQNNSDNTSETLQLQIKALENEKSTLVKEKLNARDHSLELENQLKSLSQQFDNIKSERNLLKVELDTALKERKLFEKTKLKENDGEINSLRIEKMSLQEQFDMLKKENENLMDLNGLLKDEVETLKFSLEQPKDETDNLSDLNVSLQTDIVKLETKLSAYKQENAALLIETKESRMKLKEFEAIVSECEDAKAKLSSYKTENTELLHEMKEINQVLKERGETISKQQKAIVEMERLIETLEKDRDNFNEEKEDLRKLNVTLGNDLRNAQQSTNREHELTLQVIAERDNALQTISEKDSLILSLKDEIDKLKHQQSSSIDFPSEDMSTSTISKAEEHFRMKDLDDTFEEKYTKLRIFALKLKKKLNETSTELQSVQNDKAKLEKMLSDKGICGNMLLVTNNEDVKKTNNNEHVPVVDDTVDISELQNKLKNLTIELEAAVELKVQIENLKAEIALKEQHLTAEIDAHKVTRETLEKVKRDVKKKSVLSLEMEDYERSMKELTTKMEDKKKKMVQMESTIDTQQGTINTMKAQIKLLEDQIKTEEFEIRSIKEELQQAIEIGKEKDNVISDKGQTISKLEYDLEDQKRKYEDLNVEMTTLLGEKEKVTLSLCEERIELNNKVKRLEFKCTDLEEKLKITNIELEDLKIEHTSYKVRAQAVLRQNQTVDHSQEEQLKEENAALKVQLDSLTVKFTAIQEQYDELKIVIDAEKRRAGEAAAEAARATQRTTRLQADLARVAAQLESERTHNKLQVLTLTQCYKTQISDLEMTLQNDREELKKQLVLAREGHESGARTRDKGKHIDNQTMKEEASDGEMDVNVTMLPREEGEGSEAAPSPPLKQFTVGGGGNRSPVSLERLLEEGVPDDEALDTTSLALTPEQELSDLKRKLHAQLQRVKHVTVLLAESERECARYAQMNELLKAEVRRARGSLERTQHAHNAEYMKNVTLKFVTLPPGDERSRLVPVLQKILTLNPEETQKLTAVAKGLDPSQNRGWGSYLPWPGGK